MYPRAYLCSKCIKWKIQQQMYPLPKHMKQITTTNELASTNLHIRVQYSTNATNIVALKKNDLITRECKKNRELTNIGTIYQCNLLMQFEVLQPSLLTTFRYFFSSSYLSNSLKPKLLYHSRDIYVLQ